MEGPPALLQSAHRVLAVCGLLLVAWIVVDWSLAPRLPLASGRDLGLFPVLALQLNPVLRGQLPLALGWFVLATQYATALLAALLWARLGFLARPSQATRRLALSLGLGTFAAAWFWGLRDLAPWQPAMASWRWLFDPLATIAFVTSLAALAGCYSVYPEALTQDFAQRGLDASLEWQRRAAERKRAGLGVWRLWSWLPGERYGAHGRGRDPALRGWRRLLRSRELLWLLFLAAVFVGGPQLTGWWADTPPLFHTLCWLGTAFLALLFADPVAQARMDDWILLRRLERHHTGLLMRGEIALHRFFGSPAGWALLALFGYGLYALWQSGDLLAATAAVIVAIGYSLLTFGHALGLLFLNWRHGTEENRRAISWIFLGTGGAVLAWLAAICLVGLVGLWYWLHGASDPTPERRLLGAAIIVGPSCVALAHMISLWLSVLGRGSLDPRLVVRRGTGVTALGVLLTALFVAVEGALSSQVVVHLGMPDETGALAAGTLVALAFGPLRARVDRVVGRLVQRLLPPEALVASERRTLAIAFADLSGYTRLAETDEDEALTLAAVLQQAARQAAAAHAGRLIKSIGDAVLLAFPTPAAAIAGVAELHRRYAGEVEARQLEHLPVHSGIHAGEVVVAADGDVYGAHVNLAARLQALAGPGEVVASGALAEDTARAGIAAEPLPARRFKNIAEPVDCLRWKPA